MDKTNIQINKFETTGVVLKQMKVSDFNVIFSLWQKAGLHLTDKQTELYDFQNIIKANTSSCFVLTDKNNIIGAVLGTFNGKRGWIYHLAIHPSCHHLGFGTLLLNAAEQQLKKKGAHRINLGVTLTNLKVIPFYEKNGYSVVNDALWLGKNI